MANIEGKCPKCGGALSIPEELERFSCMYCGAVLGQNELIMPRQEKAEASCSELEELHFNRILFEHMDAMESFTRSGYSVYFEKYLKDCTPVIESLNRYALEADDNGALLLGRLAEGLVEEIAAKLESDKSLRSRSAKSIALDKYKMILAIYTIPMILETRLTISDPLADSIVEAWVKRYPKSKIIKGSYEGMVAGFKKGKMCFITTAVCSSFGKPDDCYELTRFREFRDTYMAASEEGRKLVEEYYDVAPGIVTCIDMKEDPASAYKSIWKEYLKPCLSDIEAGRQEACEKRYMQMVRNLEKQYFS